MSGFRQFPRKQAHFEREEHPLFSCHSALNSNKYSFRRRRCIRNGHMQNVITLCAADYGRSAILVLRGPALHGRSQTRTSCYNSLFSVS